MNKNGEGAQGGEGRELRFNSMQLGSMNASQGLVITGKDTDTDVIGLFLGSACDINQDGISDVVIGARCFFTRSHLRDLWKV